MAWIYKKSLQSLIFSAIFLKLLNYFNIGGFSGLLKFTLLGSTTLKMLKITKFIAQNATVVNLAGSRVARPATRFYAQSGSAENKTATRDSDEPIDITNPFEKDPQQCILCKNNITPHYKNVRLLSQFQSSYTGRIYGRHITGLCKQKQEDVERAILRAQQCLLMPGYHKDLDFLQDPKLFDPERPMRPHKY